MSHSVRYIAHHHTAHHHTYHHHYIAHQLQCELLLQQRISRLDDARQHAVAEAVGGPRAHLHARCGHGVGTVHARQHVRKCGVCMVCAWHVHGMCAPASGAPPRVAHYSHGSSHRRRRSVRAAP
eukprot:scaffold32695_cov63-Phaeocystis_antarctica.AAC.3